MAQYGAQEDQLLENFGFDYDGSSDLDVAKYIHKLSEDELADFTESMTFEPVSYTHLDVYKRQTVHIPKDQYRKFAQIAWQVNVPMQTILSQFVADFTSDRWGTAEGTMAKDWFGNHWWSNFEREDFLGWLAQSNQLNEVLELSLIHI